MFDFLKRNFLGDDNEKQIKRLQKTVDKINAPEAQYQNFTDDKLTAVRKNFAND